MDIVFNSEQSTEKIANDEPSLDEYENIKSLYLLKIYSYHTVIFLNSFLVPGAPLENKI